MKYKKYRYENSTEIDVPLIQVIDDDMSNLLFLKEVMEKYGWMVIASSDPKKAVSQYFDMLPDCLVIDIDSTNRFQLLEGIEKHNGNGFIPKIAMSSQNNRLTRINAYKSGADDFFEKPIDVEEFLIRLERHVRRKQIYEQTVLVDELTQVFNRRFSLTALDKILREIQRSQQTLTIAILDIDHFSFINEKNGYRVGDQVLIELATFLKERSRPSDTVFRLGGSQFLILYPNTNAEDIQEVVNRLLDDFSTIIFDKDGRKFTVTFSAGIIQIRQFDLTAANAILLAEQALRKAKDKGKSQIEVAINTAGTIRKNKLSISIIDNDAIIRSILIKTFNSITIDNLELDIEVFEEGVTFFESNRLDARGDHLLVLEGVMPIMSGLEILQKVKSRKNKNQIRVFMLAGKKGDYEIARALKLGADDYMTKPFSITELKARIERLIQRII